MLFEFLLYFLRQCFGKGVGVGVVNVVVPEAQPGWDAQPADPAIVSHCLAYVARGA